MLEEIIKQTEKSIIALFDYNTNYGKHHTDGWGFLGVAYITSRLSPLLALPLYAAASYHFIRAVGYVPEHLIEIYRKNTEKFETKFKTFDEN